MNPLTQSKSTTILPVLIALTLACFALSPPARAVCQEGCLTNNNTVQGDDALISNNTGLNNTTMGFVVPDSTNSDNILATWIWRGTGSMNRERYSHTATLLQNGMVLVAGGYDTNNGPSFASTELSDPASRRWTATASLNTARATHTATLLPNGKVLVAGGIDSNVISSASAELYDPATGTWTATGSLNNERAAYTATLLQNGKVLVAGGFNDNPSTSAELYDPASGTWTATGSLNTARAMHTATTLQNGKVLVAGGQDSNYSILTKAELGYHHR